MIFMGDVAISREASRTLDRRAKSMLSIAEGLAMTKGITLQGGQCPPYQPKITSVFSVPPWQK